MQITTEMAQDLNSMTDDELLNELTRPTPDLEYKLYINSIALKRILERSIGNSLWRKVKSL